VYVDRAIGVAKTAGANTAAVNKIDTPSIVNEGAGGCKSNGSGCTSFIYSFRHPVDRLLGVHTDGGLVPVYEEDQDSTDESLSGTSTCIKRLSLVGYSSQIGRCGKEVLMSRDVPVVWLSG
jgi:hypothetical protein